VQVKVVTDQQPIQNVMDARLDFNHNGSLRKSYVIASSYRCGSVYLSSKLWQTGLLGAPMTYLGSRHALHPLMRRFKTLTPAAYVAALIAHRSSRNRVFGMKEHFINFEGFIKEYPPFLEVMAPMTFIYISRGDKVAQAVSMAKALQTGQWTSRVAEAGAAGPVQYDSALIANCIKEIAQQDAGWKRWFEANNITPFELTYEGLTADMDRTVRNVVQLLGVQNDEPDVVELPATKKQSDETNEKWIERFRREMPAGEEPRETIARAIASDAFAAGADRQWWIERYRQATLGEPRDDDARAGPAGGDRQALDERPPREPRVREDSGEKGASATTSDSIGSNGQTPVPVAHFCDRYERLIESLPTGKESSTGFIRTIRLRRRYDAIIGQNRELFDKARVLDLMRAHGFWSLAALDAGAAYAVGVEPTRREFRKATNNFVEYRINPTSYRLIESGIFEALQHFDRDTFDVVLCPFAEDCYFVDFFRQLIRLGPKHVIIDTKVRAGQRPIALYELTRGHGAIQVTPSHALIEFMCEDEFRWRQVDWNAMGIAHWTGIKAYATGHHRTYVLDRL
jgi:LPS sulfotransferase NodH